MLIAVGREPRYQLRQALAPPNVDANHTLPYEDSTTRQRATRGARNVNSSFARLDSDVKTHRRQFFVVVFSKAMERTIVIETLNPKNNLH